MRLGDVPVRNIVQPVKIVRVVSIAPKKEEAVAFVRLPQKRRLIQKGVKALKIQKEYENPSLKEANQIITIYFFKV